MYTFQVWNGKRWETKSIPDLAEETQVKAIKAELEHSGFQTVIIANFVSLPLSDSAGNRERSIVTELLSHTTP